MRLPGRRALLRLFDRFNLPVQIDVQPALFGLRIFPPPTARAEILDPLDRAGARSATDTGVALIVKPVVGHVIIPDIVPHLIVTPVRQRVDLDYIVVFSVQLDFSYRAPRYGLLAAQSGHPRPEIFQRAVERLDFANAAAQFAQFDGIVK